MRAPDNLAVQMAGKTSEELLAMFQRPEDWLPEALDASRAELLRRGVDGSTISVATPPAPEPTRRPGVLKVDRYRLIVLGCLLHAVALGVLGTLLEKAETDPMHQYYVPPAWVWLGLFLLWPAWSIALWFGGRERKFKVIIPLLIGGVALWPMLKEVGFGLLVILSLLSGGHL